MAQASQPELPRAFAPLPPPIADGPLARAARAATQGRPRQAPQAHFRTRHSYLLASLCALVVLPVILAALYLFRVAQDQYASHLAFSVRSDAPMSAGDLFGGLSDLGGTSSPDTDVLFDYTRSQHIVGVIDQEIDLRSRWTRPRDPMFGLSVDASIEDLHRYWTRMVRVRYDPSTGLISLRVLAFSPGDARAIALAIFDESAETLNTLADTAQQDATAYAEGMFTRAEAELKDARIALTEFRTRTQIVNPNADVQGRMGLVASLQQELADTMIEVQSLEASGRSNRAFALQEARTRRGIIEGLIATERAAMSSDTANGSSYADLVANYERLQVDLDFAQQSYVAARGALDHARAEAQKQTRFLAAHVPPTLAQTAEYPRRWMLLSLFAGTTLLFWSVCILIYYAIRDRR